MYDSQTPLWLIPALPLAAAVLTALLGPRLLRGLSYAPCIIAVAASFVLSIATLVEVNGLPSGSAALRRYYEWFQAGSVNVGLSFRADGLTVIMLLTVTFIATLIAIYSAGYMRGDPGYARYFAEVSLFVFSMTGLVLADNFLVLYAFWEGVGLCSYLLIGFWFHRPAAAAAARKAFLVTRLGDLGFILGIILLWAGLGHSLEYETVFERAAGHPHLVSVACALLFCGAVGKSAQFPLHVWLPDAMEGPSPVSALIHAATMVTAGVYMVARCIPLFREAPSVLLLVSSTGAFTALLAALIAVTQHDLKRVLAYSTVSQLGYMFMALGCATRPGLLEVAVVAAVFHLFTHAFFKALLFLSAGSIMHAMGDVIDMRRFGGLHRLLPITHWSFLCGALALAGVPLLSGFWSKDEVLSALWDAGQGSGQERVYIILFVSAVITAALTAFYTFRAYFLTFWGDQRLPPQASAHAHEASAVMTVPLIILAAGAVIAGFLVQPATHWFSHTLNSHWLAGLSKEAIGQESRPEGWNIWVMTLSTAAALGGIAAAGWVYAARPGLAGRIASRFQEAYQLSLNRFHVDELYDALVVKPFIGVAQFCRVFDLYVLDGIVDLVGRVPRWVGQAFRPMQNGLVQFYALAMALGIVVFLIAFLRAAG